MQEASSSVDLNAMAEQLEAAEIARETLPLDDYVKLLAAYLHNDELCAFKLLWRRIPDHMKYTPELQRIYRVGRALWIKLHVDAMRMVVDFGWSEAAAPVIGALKEKIRKVALDIIRESYSAISVDLFQTSMGTDREQAVRIAQQMGWTGDGQFIYPVSSAERNVLHPQALEVLEKFSKMQLDSARAQS